MKQKIFLTSALAMGVIAPAMAEPTNTGTFPSDGYMQEDYTYTNAATADNMDSVYEGEVNAVAEYDVINYIVNAGQYLPADSETVITCPAGSFCPGIDGNVQYNQTTPQGIQTCPTGYTSSAAGASSDTQCYRACNINNMGENGSISSIAHATAISGNDYYGSGTDTCEPTACVNGWHIKPGLNLTSTIGTSESGENSAWVNKAGTFRQQTFGGTDRNQAFYGITDNNTWAVYYDSTRGMLTGQARCSTTSGTAKWWEPYFSTETNLADETGQEGARYCYCNVTGYKGTDGTMQNLSSPWVFIYDYGASCAESCVNNCASSMRDTRSGSSQFRAALLGSVQSSPAMCEANTITINWSDASAADISANNAGTATYGSDVRTPVKATTKKGKTFKGWRFSKPTETNLPE